MKRALLPLALSLLAGCGDAAPPTSRGYPASAREYAALVAREPESALARYDLGTALLLARRYVEAREPLEVATRAADPALRARALYNLGNTHLEPAFADAKLADRDDALRKAIDAYKRALLLEAEDGDAKWNLELARRLLAQPPAGGGGGGGGGGEDQQSGGAGAQPEPSGGSAGGMSRATAERILAGAQQAELGVQREKLRKPQPPNPTAH